MRLYRSIATLGGWTMASRVLGFARDVLLASALGAGMLADAFFVAFKFPNFFRRLFAEGAFNSAFVPQFARRIEQDGEEPARVFAGEVASVLIVVLLVFTGIVLAAMPWLMHAIAPGFADQPEKFALTVDLTRLTFPYLLFMALVALMGGMLNTKGLFGATGAAPILLNLVMIGALLGLRFEYLEGPARVLAWAVVVAGIGQFLWMAVSLARAGLSFRLPLPRLTPGVKRVLWLMLPGMIGAGVVQINLVVDVVLASTLPEGSVSFLYYADRVNQLPLGVVGVAVGVALLPLLSRQLSAGELDAAADSQNRAIEFALLLTVPAAAAFIAVPDPIIAVLFQRGAFDAADAAATSGALAAFAAGLPAYVLIKALTPGFFAREDTATPVKIAAAAMILNVGFALALMQVLAHVGIALATALSAWLNAGTLAYLLHRRGLFRADARLRRKVPRIVFAAALMAAALVGAAALLEPAFAGTLAVKAAALAGLILLGMAVFFVTARLLGVISVRELRRMMRRNPAPSETR